MKTTRLVTAFLAVTCLVVVSCLALVSCSSSSGPDGAEEEAPPTVEGVSIADGETDVGLIERIDVTFSESMDPSTMSRASILVAGRAPWGHIEYDDYTYTASFIPDTLYAAETWHEFIVSDSVLAADGEAVEPDTTVFCTGTLDTDHLDDYNEPNETPEAAVPIALGKRYRTLSITDGDDQDYFEFTVEDTTKVLIHAWMKEVNGVSWVREFQTADGDEYWSAGTGASTGDSFAYFGYTFHPGTYLFNTHAHSYQSGWLIYDFMLTEDEPCRDDQFEDNDFIEDSKLVTEGITDFLLGCYSDRDFFRFDVGGGPDITATVTATGGYTDGTKRVTIYDHDKTVVAQTTGSGTSISASYHAIEIAPHYVSVMFWDDDVEYELDLELE